MATRTSLHTVNLDGQVISFETGRMARQASGAVVVRQGDTMLLATVVGATEPKRGKDFLPLSVDYRERMSAAGRIPGGYLKREARITDREILVSRLIDRSLRPLFPSDFRCEIQVVVTVFGADPQSDLEALGVLAASTAVHLSDLPFAGPVAGLRMIRHGRDDAPARFNVGDKPRRKAVESWMISATRGGLVMLEGGANTLGRDDLLQSLGEGVAAIEPLLAVQDLLREEAGRAKRDWQPEDADAVMPPAAATAAVEDAVMSAVGDAITSAYNVADKHERRGLLAAARASWIDNQDGESSVGGAFDAAYKSFVRQQTLAGRRIGGRGLTDIRALASEVGTLPSNHGSALFTRGETQALVSVTLGQQEESRDHDTVWGRRSERFMLHYNFPAFSVGEVKPMRGPGRREIGHGALAQRALLGVVPGTDALPFSLRVVSDILESNGSSSMATVCGASLALMDAGVAIKAPVAGIAMGLVKEGDATVVLSDILGDEDYLGDMDFKVAGSRDGITALQLDNKLGALPLELLASALDQALVGLGQILEHMETTLGQPRAHLSERAPQVVTITVDKRRVGAIIGTGGKTINDIQSQTRTRIEVRDDGRVRIFAKRREALLAAQQRIEELALELIEGGIYFAKVVTLKEYGAFVRIGEHEGLVHVSNLDTMRVDKPGDVVSGGEVIKVRVLGADARGRLVLSRKDALDVSDDEARNRRPA